MHLTSRINQAASSIPKPEVLAVLQTRGAVIEVDVSENRGTPKSSILIGFSIINHPFWGTPIFGPPQVFFHSLFLECLF